MKKCSNCGANMEDDRVFCDNCGAGGSSHARNTKKVKNHGMNGFQIFSGILYGLAIIGSMIFFANGDEISKTSGIIGILSSSILFYFMYALGEIIKQLRISNNNEEK